MRYRYHSAISLLVLLTFSFCSMADRTITDQLGRSVTLPDEVNNVVVLQHQTLNILVQIRASDSIKGVLSGWEKNLGSNFTTLLKNINELPTPGDLTQVNIESLLQINPQAVFVTNYAPEEMIAQIEKAGIPVIAVSFRKESAEQQDKMNPSIQDEEFVYMEGLKEGIQLIAAVVNREREGEELIKYAFEHQKIVANRIAAIPENQRVSVYIANPDLNTYGSGKYTGLMMRHAGAHNVAESSIEGYKQVSIEQVLAWNPAVIFVQNRYPNLVEQIRTDPAWRPIRALKENKLFFMPEYAKSWGYPTPEAIAIGELWVASRLYPERFADIDVRQAADAYYQRFYQVPYQGE